MLTSWETSVELFVSSGDTKSGTKEVTDLVLPVSSMKEFVEGIPGSVKHESGLILVIDAEEKSLKVELDAIGLEETRGHLGKVVLLDVHLGLLSGVDLGGSLSDLLSEGIEIFVLPAGDGRLEIFVDLDVVDGDASLLAPLERGWLDHGVGELTEFGLNSAVSLGEFGLLHQLLDISIEFQVVVALDILLELHSILSKSLDILDALGVDVNVNGSIEESLGELDVLLLLFSVVLLGSRLSKEESSEHGVLHL